MDGFADILSEIFLAVLSMSLTGTVAVLAVMLARCIIRKAPRALICLMWAIPAIRLVLPAAPESAFSVMPSASPVVSGSANLPAVGINSGIAAVGDIVNPALDVILAPAADGAAVRYGMLLHAAALIWLTGVCAFLAYAIVSRLKLRRRVAMSIRDDSGAYLCDGLSSPFVIGMIHPKIYLPSALAGETKAFVIAHERAHISRRDNVWKLISYVIRAVHWFNPFCLIAHMLFCRDIELACDEKVIKSFEFEEKRRYSQAVLDLSALKSGLSVDALPFGGINVKERIKKVLNYKKHSVAAIAFAAAVCAVLALCLLTNPITAQGKNEPVINEIKEARCDIEGVKIIFVSLCTEDGRLCRLNIDVENEGPDSCIFSDAGLYCGDEPMKPKKGRGHGLPNMFISSNGGQITHFTADLSGYDIVAGKEYSIVWDVSREPDDMEKYSARITFTTGLLDTDDLKGPAPKTDSEVTCRE